MENLPKARNDFIGRASRQVIARLVAFVRNFDPMRFNILGGLQRPFVRGFRAKNCVRRRVIAGRIGPGIGDVSDIGWRGSIDKMGFGAEVIASGGISETNEDA
jgi:hypothetical protein